MNNKQIVLFVLSFFALAENALAKSPIIFGPGQTSRSLQSNLLLEHLGLGLGTTPPAYSLEVKGDSAVALSGELTLDATTAVTGSSTEFLTEVAPGQAVRVNGEYKTVDTVNDDTHLTTSSAFATTGTGFPGFTDEDLLAVENSADDKKLTVSKAGNLTLWQRLAKVVLAIASGSNWTWTLPTTAGDAGQFLKTDGSGVTSWANPVTFFSPGTAAQVTQVLLVGDTLGSLNNTYFNLYSAKDTTHYVPWFNVSGAGTDPAIGGTTSLEVDITIGDSAAAVSAALAVALTSTGDFVADTGGLTTLPILNGSAGANYGAATEASDGDTPTGFTITTLTPGADTDPTASCSTGRIKYDTHYVYFCIATNTWKRVAVNTW